MTSWWYAEPPLSGEVCRAIYGAEDRARILSRDATRERSASTGIGVEDRRRTIRRVSSSCCIPLASSESSAVPGPAMPEVKPGRSATQRRGAWRTASSRPLSRGRTPRITSLVRRVDPPLATMCPFLLAAASKKALALPPVPRGGCRQSGPGDFLSIGFLRGAAILNSSGGRRPPFERFDC